MISETTLSPIIDLMIKVQNYKQEVQDSLIQELGEGPHTLIEITDYYIKHIPSYDYEKELRTELKKLDINDFRCVIALMLTGREVRYGYSHPDSFKGHLILSQWEEYDSGISYLLGLNPIADNLKAGIKAITDSF